MAVLIVLFGPWLIFRGIGTMGVIAFASWHGSARYGLAIMFLFTAMAHFNRGKHDLAQMAPPVFPRSWLFVHWTGVIEFAAAVHWPSLVVDKA
jgi:hypothetical protein